MKKFIYLLVLGLTFISQSVFSQLQNTEPPFIDGEVIVRMQKGQNPGHLPRLVPAFYELKVEEQLSKYSDIWLLSFNKDNIDIASVITELYKVKSVYQVQKNRILEQRETTPNDPQYGSQWQLPQIDAPLAWDITTGGSTPSGTDIVVAVIESSDVKNHPDLLGNHWKNTAEIPGNGIDDDGNGYVDDYNGWNVASQNDNVGTGSHGTSCAGMIGAKGNNNLGVSGINWDVKIMVVAGHSTPFTEANIVSCYEYALQQRLIWNNTNGAEGAFVVATSSSWGIDQANPANYPIWCGYYEDMGEVGLLNAGATSNSNYNIDQTGDVPSACPSDYMISVTATNSSDIINFAGYGQNTINVAAPGSAIHTTGANGGYTTTSGTSFATPLTAGLIGLLYSVPCPNLEIMAKADPQGTADLVRQALFDGVDQTAYLSTRTTTGGRINAKNSIDILMDLICSDCNAPFAAGVTDKNENSASISFETEAETSYSIYIQVAGSGNWTSYTNSSGNYTFTGLNPCEDYEFYIVANCAEEDSSPSPIFTFKTTGCGNCVDLEYCESFGENPADNRLVVFNPSSVQGSKTFTKSSNFGGNVTGATRYGELVLVNDGTSTPTLGCNALTNASEVNGKIAVILRGTCEFAIKVKNAQNAGAIAAIVINNVASPATLDMGGTDNTITIPAIMISQADGNALINAINANQHPMALLGDQNDWIQSFAIDGYTNNSGDNDGYAFFQDGISLNAGQTYPFTLAKGSIHQPVPMQTRIYIDVNQDGVFESSEIVYDSGVLTSTTINGVLTIPVDVMQGSTRMRIQSFFQGGYNPSSISPCDEFYSGEVEDYCITLLEAGESCGMEVTSTINQPTCASNADGSIAVEMQGGNTNYTFNWSNGQTTSFLNSLTANQYVLTITDTDGCDTTIVYNLNYTRNLQIMGVVTNTSCQHANDGEISVLVTGGNSYTYTWSGTNSNQSTVTGLAPGNYSVIAMDEIGCKITESYTVESPIVQTVTANFSKFISGLSVTFNNTSQNGTYYQWDFGDGSELNFSQSPTHIFAEAGTYIVCLTTSTDCDTVTTCQEIKVFGSSSLETEELSQLIVYPNPANDIVTIEFGNFEVTKINVTTTEGKALDSFKVSENTLTIDVKKWATGIYILQAVDKHGNTIATQRVNKIP